MAVAKEYGQRPSAILGIEDPYTAYCLDEACSYIANQLRADKSPQFLDDPVKSNRETVKKLQKMGGIKID